MSEGYIVFQINTSRAELPIEGAYASVTKGSDSTRELIGFRITNESGKTTPIKIETPPRDLSTHPSEETPFTLCDIRVDHPDYYTVQVRDVQIFDGITSLQQLQMIPLEENSNPDNRSEEFSVAAQNL